MADKRSVGHAYNIDFLNVVFAVSSLFVLVTTVWMVWTTTTASGRITSGSSRGSSWR